MFQAKIDHAADRQRKKIRIRKHALAGQIFVRTSRVVEDAGSLINGKSMSSSICRLPSWDQIRSYSRRASSLCRMRRPFGAQHAGDIQDIPRWRDRSDPESCINRCASTRRCSLDRVAALA